MTDSVYSLLGTETNHKVKMQIMEKVFSSMDTNKDGVVTKEEFVHYCQNKEDVLKAFQTLP